MGVPIDESMSEPALPSNQPTPEPSGRAESRKSFLLRISPELWRDLEAWAQEELRSVNGQIEYLLKQAVQRRKRNAVESGEPPQAQD